jgi:hypothetical protein
MPAATAETEKPQPRIEELKPEILYLRDKSGRLVPVPGFLYEDFMEMVEQKARRDAPATEVPDFSIQQVTIDGEAAQQTATLVARIDMTIRRPDWVQVPLGLGEGALTRPAEYEGRGDHFLHFDARSGQYVVWLRGAAGAEHRLTLHMQAPLKTTLGQHKLALNVPRAASSKLTLKVAATDIVASAAPSRIVPEVTSDGQSSAISLLGVAGDVVVTWSPATRAATPLESILESTGTLLVKIDGRSVTSDAALNVRSFGGEFDRFRVRLPKGATLTGGQQAGYTLTSVGTASSPLVDVKLDKPTTGPVEVRVLTERAFDLTSAGEVLDLAGFQVVEAVAHRQGGQIGVVVAGDWQLIWEDRVRVRQIDEPVEALQRPDLLAAFEYVGQPCALTARVAPRRTRVSVDPEYVYYVSAHETRLDARLKYSIRGAKAFSLDLDLHGWEVEDVGPASLIDARSIDIGDGSRLSIPLLQPTVGDVEITIRARRAHSNDSGDLELQLPVPQSAVAAPASVALVLDDNVELATQAEKLVALSPQRLRPDLRLPPRRQDPLVFRAERPDAKYAGRLTVRPQKVVVDVASTANLTRESAAIEQRFGYQVLYEPVDRLHFAVPARLAATTGYRVFVDGMEAPLELVSADDGSADSVRMQLRLPEPRTGLFAVVGRFELPLSQEQRDGETLLDLPLAMPLEGELSANTLAVNVQSGMRAKLRGEHWKVAGADEGAQNERLRLTAATAVAEAPLSVEMGGFAAARTVAVQRAWIQTWLSDQARQERAVFVATSSEPRVSIQLPAGASAGELEVMLDNRPSRWTVRPENVVVVDWPSADAPHVLELRYLYAPEKPGAVSVALEAPVFGQSAGLHRCYWQLVLPSDRHLFGSGANLTPQFAWQWNRLHLSRVNTLDQADLEEWTGALNEADPTGSANVYLFSAMGQPQSTVVWVVARSLIVFAASLAVLAAAFLILYVPQLRRPQTLVVVGLFVLALALAYPEPAILLGQAAALGLVLAIAAAVLHRIAKREPIGDESRRPQPSSIIEHSATELYHHPLGAQTSSSAAAALAFERSQSDSHVR